MHRCQPNEKFSKILIIIRGILCINSLPQVRLVIFAYGTNTLSRVRLVVFAYGTNSSPRVRLVVIGQRVKSRASARKINDMLDATILFLILINVSHIRKKDMEERYGRKEVEEKARMEDTRERKTRYSQKNKNKKSTLRRASLIFS